MNSAVRALLDELDPEQRRVAQHTGGPLIVLAGAGTGKTRAMTHRIAVGELTGERPAEHTLALTFTAKAAGEMRSRLRALGITRAQARTFHSAALRQLRYFWPALSDGPFPDIMEHKAGPLGHVMRGLGLSAERELVRDVAAEIEYAAVSLISIDEYAARAAQRTLPGELDPAVMCDIMRGYGELKTQRRLIDFEDVLLALTGALATREDLAAKVRSQYRHFVVDEFQDVSPLQYDLLMRWLGPRDSLCVVGDPAQTIYSFAGATDRYLLTLSRQWEHARTIELVRNYRSRPPIVEAANRVLAHTAGTPLTLRAHRTGGAEPTFTEYPDDAAEAAGVASRVAAQISEGVRASEIAVLFRANSQSRALEAALAARGVSYVVRGGEGFFVRREVQEAMVLLRSSAARRQVGPLGEAVREILSSIGWQRVAPAAGGALREKWESLNSLVELADDLQAGSELPVSIEQFSAELADRREHQHAPTVNGVVLASIHAAKGLEWSRVHLVGLTEGLLPISYATTAAAIAEERRLFYVAVTRARDTLDLSWSQARHENSRTARRASRFVSEMRGPTAQVRSAGANSRIPVCRRCSRPLSELPDRRMGRCRACAPAPDAQAVAAVSRWRSQKARQLRVPDYMVLTQETVLALAEVHPRSRDELAVVPGIGPAKLEQFGAELLELFGSLRAAGRSSGR